MKKKEAQGLLFLSQSEAGYSGTQMLLDQSDFSGEFIEPHIDIFAVFIEHRLFRMFVKADEPVRYFRS